VQLHQSNPYFRAEDWKILIDTGHTFSQPFAARATMDEKTIKTEPTDFPAPSTTANTITQEYESSTAGSPPGSDVADLEADEKQIPPGPIPTEGEEEESLPPKKVDWDGEDDQENPLNWDKGKKWGNTAVIAMMTFVSYAFTIVCEALSE